MTSRPFDRVHIDLMGPFPETEEGYVYVLSIKEKETQWVELVALKDKTMEAVTRAINDSLIQRHGRPGVIITDNGSEFVNKVMQQYCRLANVKHRTVAPYHPEANGLVENSNRTMKDMLAVIIDENQRNWDRVLPMVAHSYRCTVNAMTGVSPFFAVYGRHPRIVSSEWLDGFVNKDKVLFSQYLEDLTRTLQTTWDAIDVRLREEQRKAVDRHNYEFRRQTYPELGLEPKILKERVFRQFDVGSWFYLLTTPKRFIVDDTPGDAETRTKWRISAKLSYRYTGPHRVVKVINPVMYLANIDGVERRVHATLMKRDYSRQSPFMDVDIPFMDEPEEDLLIDDEELDQMRE
jgi:hypothetical protein